MTMDKKQLLDLLIKAEKEGKLKDRTLITKVTLADDKFIQAFGKVVEGKQQKVEELKKAASPAPAAAPAPLKKDDEK